MQYETEFWRLLRERMEREAEIRAGIITDGKIPDYPSYKQHVGFLQGLIWVQNEAQNVAEDINNRYKPK